MSYINDALNRAQREKDSRYQRFGPVLSTGPEGPAWPRRALVAGLGLLLLVALGLLATFLTLRSASLPEAEKSPPVREATTAAPEAAAGEKKAGPQAAAPETPAAREAERQFQAAVAAQRRGDLKGAEALYRQVLALAPDHVQALNNLGVLYMGRGQRERAIALFSRAVVLKKDYVDPYYNLACLYARHREIDESLWYLKIAMGLNNEVRQWAQQDADLKEVVASPAFRTLREGQKN